jgi:methionine-S-sulfoxide reductase
MKTIYLAGGCFWGVERYFSLVKGVVTTKVGYANGTKDNPKYEDLKHGLDDASETVKIDYDEKVVSLEKLLELYLRVINPYSVNKQGEDEGVQYRTGIYFTKMGDEEIVKTYFDELNLKDHKIELLYLKQFYPAEEYHQQYLEKHPDGYCHVNMAVLHEDEKKVKEENKESL